MPNMKRPDVWTTLLPMLILTIGCSKPPDQRLIELGEQANARQQAQNEVIARQTEKTAELSQGFIDAEAKARQDLLQLQRQLVDADAQSREDLQQIHQVVVQRDADGRRELVELHRQAHAAISARTQAIDGQRDVLEQERRQIAIERMRTPVVAEAVKFAGGLIVCLTPLLVVVYLLRCLRNSNDNTDTVVIETLVGELLAERPRLLATAIPRALPGSRTDSNDAATAS